MFIGEMGCWLVIGLLHLYRSYQARWQQAATGYEPLAANDDVVENGDTEEPTSPVMKAITANKTHPELKGLKILLLSLPASMLIALPCI